MQPDGADWGRPLYEQVLDAVGPVNGGPLLDVGCGTGWLCRLAASRGIPVIGVDADPTALARATRLVPEAGLVGGALPALPVRDGTAGAVTCVQVLMHVPDPLAALRELARTARGGARLVVTVWGAEEECAIGAFGRALAPLLHAPVTADPPRRDTTSSRAATAPRSAVRPPPRPAGPLAAGPTDRPPPRPAEPLAAGPADRPPPRPAEPPPLHAAGRLAKLAQLAGLRVERAEDARCPLDYPDERALLADLYAAQLGRRALAAAGRATVRRAVLAGLAPYRRPAGGYRLENTFRLVVARTG